MKLFIKRNTSPDKSCFTVFDEYGNEKYNAAFTGSKSVSKLIVSDNAEKAVLKIRKIPIVGTHTFAFKAGKHHITFVMIISSNSLISPLTEWPTLRKIRPKETERPYRYQGVLCYFRR